MRKKQAGDSGKANEALEKKIGDELVAAWKSEEHKSEHPRWFGTSQLQKLRDSLTPEQTAMLARQPDNVFCQLFAFHVAKVRFPKRCPAVGASVVLTTDRPAMPLMSDVYDYLSSLTNGSFDEDALFTSAEQVPLRSISNGDWFAGALQADVLQKWFERRCEKIPAELQSCVLDTLCGNIPRDKWSPLMKSQARKIRR